MTLSSQTPHSIIEQKFPKRVSDGSRCFTVESAKLINLCPSWMNYRDKGVKKERRRDTDCIYFSNQPKSIMYSIFWNVYLNERFISDELITDYENREIRMLYNKLPISLLSSFEYVLIELWASKDGRLYNKRKTIKQRYTFKHLD